MGWLLEQSETGCAFAWRGSVLPSVGNLIEVNVQLTGDVSETRNAIVKRVETVHDNITIIALQFVETVDARVTAAAKAAQAELLASVAEPDSSESSTKPRIAA